mgnify:FL=1
MSETQRKSKRITSLANDSRPAVPCAHGNTKGCESMGGGGRKLCGFCSEHWISLRCWRNNHPCARCMGESKSHEVDHAEAVVMLVWTPLTPHHHLHHRSLLLCRLRLALKQVLLCSLGPMHHSHPQRVLLLVTITVTVALRHWQHHNRHSWVSRSKSECNNKSIEHMTWMRSWIYSKDGISAWLALITTLSSRVE